MMWWTSLVFMSTKKLYNSNTMSNVKMFSCIPFDHHLSDLSRALLSSSQIYTHPFLHLKNYFHWQHWITPLPLSLNLIQNEVTWQWLTKPIISHIWIYYVILQLHHNEKLQHISFHTVLYICSSCFHIMTLHDHTIQVT